MSQKYVLRDKKPVLIEDLYEWAKEYDKCDRKVAQEYVGRFFISTIFLGLDYNHRDGKPQLFETMIYNEDEQEWVDYQERYGTYEEAEAGHLKAIEFAKQYDK